MDDVHQIKEVSKEKGFVAKCGHVAMAEGGRKPGNFTAWASDVTCAPCRLP